MCRYSVGLFDNPYYREQMFALGLRPETAYGCAYNFLLYPQPQVWKQLFLMLILFEQLAFEHRIRLRLQLLAVPAAPGAEITVSQVAVT